MLHLSKRGRSTEGKDSKASCSNESAEIVRAILVSPVVSWARWNVAKAMEYEKLGSCDRFLVGFHAVWRSINHWC